MSCRKFFSSVLFYLVLLWYAFHTCPCMFIAIFLGFFHHTNGSYRFLDTHWNNSWELHFCTIWEQISSGLHSMEGFPEPWTEHIISLLFQHIYDRNMHSSTVFLPLSYFTATVAVSIPSEISNKCLYRMNRKGVFITGTQLQRNFGYDTSAWTLILLSVHEGLPK